MASKSWPIEKPVTRSMTRQAPEDSDEEPQPRLTSVSSNSVPPVISEGSSSTSSLGLNSNVQHSPASHPIRGEVFVSTAACSASQQTMDPVRRPVVNPIERPSCNCGRQPSVVKCQLGPHLALPLEMSTMMLALVAVNQAWLSAS